MTVPDVEALAAASTPEPIFASPAFAVKGSYVQISPCDERCQAGAVSIQPNAHGAFPEISGELFALRQVAWPASAIAGAIAPVRKYGALTLTA